MNAILISGGNWNGGQIQATPGSRIKSIQVKSRGGVGGRVRVPVHLIVDLLEKLTAGDVLGDFTLTGNLKTGTLGRIIGNVENDAVVSLFNIPGDVLKGLRTTSQRGRVFPATNVFELLNPPVGNDGILQIDQLIDPVKIRTV